MKLKLEKTKYYWTYVLFGVLCTVLGVTLLPPWSSTGVFFSSWGAYSVNIMISGLIFGYICFYLVKRIKRYSNTPAQIVSVVELVLMAVIAIVCTVSLFVGDVSLGDPCQIFALVVWARGVSGVFTGYYCDSNIVRAAEEERRARKSGKMIVEKTAEKSGESEQVRSVGRVDDFTVWRLVFAVFLISMGTYLFFNPIIKAIHLQWVFSSATFCVGLFFFVFGFAIKPVKEKAKDVPADKAPASASGKGADSAELGKSNGESLAAEGNGAAELDTDAKEEKKISINISNSATAMTKTAAYDAVKEETALVTKENEQES